MQIFNQCNKEGHEAAKYKRVACTYLARDHVIAQTEQRRYSQCCVRVKFMVAVNYYDF